MERSTCPKQGMYAVDVVAFGTMRARCVTTGLPFGCEALRVRTTRAALCAGTCRWQHAGWNSGPFSSQVHRSPWAAAIYYLFMKLVNYLNGNKWIKSYKNVIFCNKWKFCDPFITEKSDVLIHRYIAFLIINGGSSYMVINCIERY